MLAKKFAKVTIVHVFRQENLVVNLVAKQASATGISVSFTTFYSLPPSIESLCILDSPYILTF
jgi:hypothetical protein